MFKKNNQSMSNSDGSSQININNVENINCLEICISEEQKKKYFSVSKILESISNLEVDSFEIEIQFNYFQVKEKCLINNIKIYQERAEEFQSGNMMVQKQIKNLLFSDRKIEDKLIRYVVNKYSEEKNIENFSPDNLILNIAKRIREEFESSNLPDDLECIHYLIYYTFCRCKIFKAPNPRNYT